MSGSSPAAHHLSLGPSPSAAPCGGEDVNKAELVKELETRLGSRKAANDALAHVVDVIIREVAKGGKVAITGFGTFEKSARAARTGRNPRTGETVRIRKTNVPKFRAGAGFKDVVANPKKLPKAAVAGARAAAGTATKVATSAAGTTVKKAAPARKAATVKKAATPRKAAPATKAAPARKAAPAERAAAAPAKKAAPARKTVAAKKTTPVKKAAPAKKATAVKKTAPAKKAASTAKTTAKKTTTKRAAKKA